jgi:hypothetical protein
MSRKTHKPEDELYISIGDPIAEQVRAAEDDAIVRLDARIVRTICLCCGKPVHNIEIFNCARLAS